MPELGRRRGRGLGRRGVRFGCGEEALERVVIVGGVQQRVRGGGALEAPAAVTLAAVVGVAVAGTAGAAAAAGRVERSRSASASTSSSPSSPASSAS
ncbi:MAG: hypothetical protein VX181_19780, partial [Pseudomonadota bacterium]|nr:hypothetical protein [Pseudomonadota bacterium]